MNPPALDLVYCLYTSCERKGWVLDARGFNGLIITGPHITQLASRRWRTDLSKEESMIRGFTLWMTGLSGRGKTTSTHLLERHLRVRGRAKEEVGCIQSTTDDTMALPGDEVETL